MSQAASTSHEKDVLRVLARVTKSQQKYPHDIPAVVNIKSSTTFLRHKASTLSTELHHCVRWGDKARQDILEKRLRRIHRDLMVLRGRSNEATAGATQVLLAPITKTKTPAHDKGGQWLVSMCKTNKKRIERNRMARLQEGTRNANRTLSPLLLRRPPQRLQRPQSAQRLLSDQRRTINSEKNTIRNRNRNRNRPQSATNANASRLVVNTGNTKAFVRLQQDSATVLEKLLAQLKHARNDGLHLSGGNLLCDPAEGDLVRKLSKMYQHLYEGVNGKLDIMLER